MTISPRGYYEKESCAEKQEQRLLEAQAKRDAEELESLREQLRLSEEKIAKLKKSVEKERELKKKYYPSWKLEKYQDRLEKEYGCYDQE